MGNYPRFVLQHLDVKTRSGMEWQCLCPYHEDSSPSFSINVRKGLFICYACGAKGNMNDLAKHLQVRSPNGEFVPVEESLDNLEEQIAQYRATKSKPRRAPVNGNFWTSRYRLGNDWKTHWENRLPSITKPIGSTAIQLGVSLSIADMFSLGYDHMRHELVIPIFNFNGSAETAVRRRLGEFDGPKYLYAKGFKTSHHLFGAWQVRTLSSCAKATRVAIVEGTIDALSMWLVGVPAVAILGSNLSATQARLLQMLDAREYVIMTDRDRAGRKAQIEIEAQLRGKGAILLEPTYWPQGCKDVAEMDPASRLKAATTATELLRFS